ncbi:MAG: IclR family transcriptional regulator [Bacillota bacterium]
MLTLEKALEIIEQLKNCNSDGLGISFLSDTLGLGKSTVHRILDTLMTYDFVEKCPNSSKYRLTWKLFEIGSTIPRQRNLDYFDTKILHELCGKYKETVNLAIRVRNKAVIISKVDPQDVPVKVNLGVGEHDPLHATALGKVLISELDSDELLAIFGGEQLEQYTGNTITSLNELASHLAKVREAGYAFDLEEYSPGLTCLAVPIRNYTNQVIAAISISGPSFRLQHNKIMSIIEDLKSTCREYSNYLGASRATQADSSSRPAVDAPFDTAKQDK